MIVNLDKLSADFSQKILDLKEQKVEKDKFVTPESIEKICTSALGVLQEQGVYASTLFLLSKSGDKNEQKKLSIDEFAACGIVANLIKMLNANELKEIGCAFANDLDKNTTKVNTCKSELLKHISCVVAGDLKKLLLVKSLYEQTLIYARYGAKALSLSEGNL
jgi:hypothetical protein